MLEGRPLSYLDVVSDGGRKPNFCRTGLDPPFKSHTSGDGGGSVLLVCDISGNIKCVVKVSVTEYIELGEELEFPFTQSIRTCPKYPKNPWSNLLNT